MLYSCTHVAPLGVKGLKQFTAMANGAITRRDSVLKKNWNDTVDGPLQHNGGMWQRERHTDILERHCSLCTAQWDSDTVCSYLFVQPWRNVALIGYNFTRTSATKSSCMKMLHTKTTAKHTRVSGSEKGTVQDTSDTVTDRQMSAVGMVCTSMDGVSHESISRRSISSGRQLLISTNHTQTERQIDR